MPTPRKLLTSGTLYYMRSVAEGMLGYWLSNLAAPGPANHPSSLADIASALVATASEHGRQQHIIGMLMAALAPSASGSAQETASFASGVLEVITEMEQVWPQVSCFA